MPADVPLDDRPDREIVRRARAVSGDVVGRDPRPPRPEQDDLPQQADIERFSDVTVACPHCGTRLYDDVSACWQCGRSLTEADRRRPGFVAMVLILLTLLALVLLAARF